MATVTTNTDQSDGGLGPLPVAITRPKKMGMEVASQLRDMIFSGHLVPGQRLRLQDLAQQLDVSTTPVREALLVLERDGLVTSEQHRGFRVTSLSRTDILDVYELHAFIAATLVQRATEHLTEEDLGSLHQLDREIQVAVRRGEPDKVDTLNYQFHRLINCRAEGSVMLRKSLRETTRLVPRRFYKEISGWLDASAEDHGVILEALGRRDAGEAARLTAEHIRRAGTLLVEHLSKTNAW